MSDYPLTSERTAHADTTKKLRQFSCAVAERPDLARRRLGRLQKGGTFIGGEVEAVTGGVEEVHVTLRRRTVTKTPGHSGEIRCARAELGPGQGHDVTKDVLELPHGRLRACVKSSFERRFRYRYRPRIVRSKRW